MTQAHLALALAAAAFGGALAWLAILCTRIDAGDPERLVVELRVVQLGSLLLAIVAAVYLGVAVANPNAPGAGLDIALAMGFFVVAGLATTVWEPAAALPRLALAWAAHGAVDMAHAAALLPALAATPWYPTACAMYDVIVAGLCYVPLLRR
ncbi:MAG: hypothetical protein OXF93_04620 [Acidobacteria bacterium]|nr:hypothetical protein [Acidobacteriota bacterium]